MAATVLLSPNGQQTTVGDGPATRMFVATIKGVVRLDRPAPDAPWKVTNQTLAELHVSALVLEPGSGKLFAGAHGEGGVWVNDDGAGTQWRRVSNGLERLNVYSLAARRQGKEATIFAGVEPAALYRSDDLGESWRELPGLRGVPGTDKWTFPPPPHIAHVKCITVHPTRPQTLFTCIEQGALLKSEDDGQNWLELDGYVRPDDRTYKDTHRIEIHPRVPKIAYLTTGLGINRSDDGGRTWRALSEPAGARLGYPDFIAFDPQNPDIVNVAGAATSPNGWAPAETANSAVLKSIDGGRTWREPRTGLPNPIVGAIEAMNRYAWPGGATLTFATATGEVFASDDVGETWKTVVRDLAPASKGVHYRAFLPGAKARGRAVWAG